MQKKMISEIHQSNPHLKHSFSLKKSPLEFHVTRTFIWSTTKLNSIYGQCDYLKVTVNKRSAMGKEHLSTCESLIMPYIYRTLTVYQGLFFVYVVNPHKDLVNRVRLLSSFYRQRDRNSWRLSNIQGRSCTTCNSEEWGFEPNQFDSGALFLGSRACFLPQRTKSKVKTEYICCSCY